MERTRKDLYIGIASIAVWAIAAFLLLSLRYSDYMHKVQELSMFVGTSTFLQQCMSLPGGLVIWSSTFLTSLFADKYIGAATMVAVLLLLQISAIKAFRLPREWWAASAILPVLALVAFLRLGYDIFVIKPLGYAFALPIGLLFSALIYWGYRKIGDCRLRSAAIAVLVIAGYAYFGFYALLAAFMCGCNRLSVNIGDRKWLQTMPMIVALVFIICVPQGYFRFCTSDLMPSQIYLSPLPRFFASETGMWVLYASLFALMALGALSAGQMRSRQLPVSLAAWAFGMAALFVLPTSDKNLMHTLAMDRALNNQEWGKAANLANSIDFEPTRLNTALGYVAHLRNGTLGNQLFASKYGWAPYNASRKGDPMHDAGGAIISYHLGLVNYAYRWATEYMIEQGMGAERMKMMVKCALLNFETDLAKHYLNILYNVPNQRAWAKKYMKYASNPMEMGRDDELLAVRQLMCQPSIFINDGGSVEDYVWHLLASAPEGTPQFTELSIYAALIIRDLDQAMAKIPAYVTQYGKATKAMQEAALYWAKCNNAAYPIEIDKSLEAQYDYFMQAFKKTANLGAEAQREALREPYGNTLWYYLAFTEDKEIR